MKNDRMKNIVETRNGAILQHTEYLR